MQPDTKSLPNGEQVAQTRIISASGEAHELDYVMRQVNGGWKAVDVLADGSISRVAVQRSDFRRLVSRGGAPGADREPQPKTSDLSGGALTVAQTVATGVAGEPTAPGRRSGGPVNRKRLRLLARSQSASSVR